MWPCARDRCTHQVAGCRSSSRSRKRRRVAMKKLLRYRSRSIRYRCKTSRWSSLVMKGAVKQRWFPTGSITARSSHRSQASILFSLSMLQELPLARESISPSFTVLLWSFGRSSPTCKLDLCTSSMTNCVLTFRVASTSWATLLLHKWVAQMSRKSTVRETVPAAAIAREESSWSWMASRTSETTRTIRESIRSSQLIGYHGK